MAAKKKKAKRVSKAAPARAKVGAKVGTAPRAARKKRAKAASPRASGAGTRPRISPKGDGVGDSALAGTIGAGDAAPSFTLPDESGAQVSSDELAGSPYVLYFYPKDDTPGCTTEACGFRDALPQFEKLGVRVLGVSPDSSASHQRFRAKYELPFTLLSDADKSLSTAYGAWALKKNYGREYMGVVRSTFLVDARGVIRNVWRGVKVNGHVEKVQAAAAALG
ncbi:MAG TPA: thioredoxin-dependent thiol peroxidase [Polyangiaceae bacterium]|jgi:peroxiredoxin Q/BCP|nr:thioredoxin-dependent thiol peroxidase [Polyangiaceae bacterium]